MSLVKCMECGDIIESTDQKACVQHSRHHNKHWKDIAWELLYDAQEDTKPKNVKVRNE